jgi:hypothetical protein
MSPVIRNNVDLGPPNPAKFTKSGDYEFKEVSEFEEQEEEMASPVVFFINEDNLLKCPQIEIVFSNGTSIGAILDSGSEVNLLSEKIYDRLVKSGVEVPVLPLESVVLVTAFGRRSRKIRSQALVEFTIGRDTFEGVFMISPQLTSEAIIGCPLLKEYGININFERGSITYAREGRFREQIFDHQLHSEVGSDGRRSEENPVRNPSPKGQLPYNPTADRKHPTPSSTVFAHQTSTQPQTESADIGSEWDKDASSPLNDDEVSDVREEKGNSNPINGAVSDRIYSEKLTQSKYATAEAASRCDGYLYKDAARNKKLLLSRVGSELQTQIHVPTPEQDFSDPRSLRKTDLSALIEQIVDLNKEQKRDLYEILVKYLDSFTSKPGVCKLFSYKFQVEADRPIVGYNRPIAFALRPAVRQQIEQMLKDDILEASSSPFLNPLTIVHREGKKIRICVDARKINQNTVSDRERTTEISVRWWNRGICCFLHRRHSGTLKVL